MAENDIYDSKARYERFKVNVNLLVKTPEQTGNKKAKYYCKNKINLNYFNKLFPIFEAKDTSYIRRCRLLQTLKITTYAIDKDLAKCEREDIDKIIAFMHSVCASPKSKQDFIRDTKYLWKLLFPEKDERGRQDETIMPYVVRHLSAKIDKSKEKLRNDRLSWEEFEKLLNYFSFDLRMQAYLFLALESLGRPQELLYVKLKDVELYDNYAKIWISEHGKEGTGFLQCIDSFPYVSKWYNMHPLRHDKNAFLFVIIESSKERYEQLKPQNVNKMLWTACKLLRINKTITAYSLKRNGVTFRRLRGDSDVEIQHAARWTSTKQLKTYDMSQQEDAFKMELIKRGILDTTDPKFNHLKPKIKVCMFCNKKNVLINEICDVCNRPLDREKIREQEKAREQLNIQLKNELETLKSEVNNKTSNFMENFFQNPDVQELFKTVYKLQKEIELYKK